VNRAGRGCGRRAGGTEPRGIDRPTGMLTGRNQRRRLEKLEVRIDDRRTELDRQEQIISLAPVVEGYCLTLLLE